MSGEQSPEWQIFLTEWAALASYELMYQARQGHLHFITVDLRGLIRDLGFKTIMFDRDDLARRLETLIDEIDMNKCLELSPQNRSLPEHACDTIVSITGNWVAFDTEAWETQMEDNMYLIPDEWGAKAFDYPRVALTGLIDRKAEEKRTTRPARAGGESGVPQRFRLLELEAPDGLEVREAPQPQEEAPLRFPNARAQRRLARTLDLFMVKAGIKPLITDYGYPEGLTLDNMVDIVRLHLGTCAKHRPSAGPAVDTRASGSARSSSIKAEGQPERAEGTIRQQMDREEERELQAKRQAEAVTAKERRDRRHPFLRLPRSELERFREGSSGAPLEASEKPLRAANCRLDVEVIDLLSDGEDAIMTDAES